MDGQPPSHGWSLNIENLPEGKALQNWNLTPTLQESILFQMLYRLCGPLFRLCRLCGRLHRLCGRLHRLCGRLHRLRGRLHRLCGRLGYVGLFHRLCKEKPDNNANFFLPTNLVLWKIDSLIFYYLSGCTLFNLERLHRSLKFKHPFRNTK